MPASTAPKHMRRRRCRSALVVLLFALLALGYLLYDRKEWRKNARRIAALDLSLAVERNRSSALARVVAASLAFRNQLRVLEPPRNAHKFRLASVRDALNRGASDFLRPSPPCAF